jgi:regulator of sigma D
MKKTIKRINKAFGKIYDMGDSGLDYMDKCVEDEIMQHVYNETLTTLSKAELEELADTLEAVVYNAEFDLEVF